MRADAVQANEALADYQAVRTPRFSQDSAVLQTQIVALHRYFRCALPRKAMRTVSRLVETNQFDLLRKEMKRQPNPITQSIVLAAELVELQVRFAEAKEREAIGEGGER